MLNRELPALVPKIAAPEPLPVPIAMRVVAYLERMRLAIMLRNRDGTISMPELVNLVRQNVPESLAGTPCQIEMEISETLGGDTPPPVRGVAAPTDARRRSRPRSSTRCRSRRRS